MVPEEGGGCFAGVLGCDSGTSVITELLESIPLSTGALCQRKRVPRAEAAITRTRR